MFKVRNESDTNPVFNMIIMVGKGKTTVQDLEKLSAIREWQNSKPGEYF